MKDDLLFYESPIMKASVEESLNKGRNMMMKKRIEEAVKRNPVVARAQ